MSYQVIRNFHPSHKVTNLHEAEQFFQQVFGSESIPIAKYLPPKEAAPQYPRDYSILTPIADVLFDCLDPSRYVVEGRQTYEGVSESHLFCFAFAVEGIEELYKTLIAHGIRSTDQANRLGNSKGPPCSGFSSRPLFFTLPESTGLRYQISSIHSIGSLDRRSHPDWRMPTSNGPLGIEYCAYHTILTKDVKKQLRFLVDILHGTVIHHAYNELLDVESVFVALADGVYELATPVTEGSFAMTDSKFNSPFDTYHSLTWKVHDLVATEGHLAANNVAILFRNEDTIITDPGSALGIPWGFTSKNVPGDMRSSQVESARI